MAKKTKRGRGRPPRRTGWRGDEMRRLRLAAGYSAEELASVMELAPPPPAAAIYRWETRGHCPPPDAVRAIARALRCSQRSLFDSNAVEAGR